MPRAASVARLAVTRAQPACDSRLMDSEQTTSPARGRAEIAANMARFDRVESAATGLRLASVAVCVVGEPDRLSLVITKRAPRLRSHAGQWALPGGSRDPGETIEDAALREMAEETGLELGPDAVLGLLDDYVTRSGYLISPVVVWGGPASPAMRRQAAEVAQIHVIPLADFDVEPRLLRIPESEFPVIQLPLLGRYLHAPAAAVIYQFCRIGLHGETVRVAHFEQPVFAWK
jgi:8-oxo-dGTP pyrophosphatase MutT (NUDIX family)